MPLDRLDPAQLLALLIVFLVFASIVGLVLGIVSTVTNAAARRREIAADLVRDLVVGGVSIDDVRRILRDAGFGSNDVSPPDWTVTTTTTVAEAGTVVGAR